MISAAAKGLNEPFSFWERQPPGFALCGFQFRVEQDQVFVIGGADSSGLRSARALTDLGAEALSVAS